MTRTVIATRINVQTHDQLKQLGLKQDRTVAWLTRKAIEEFVTRATRKRTA